MRAKRNSVILRATACFLVLLGAQTAPCRGQTDDASTHEQFVADTAEDSSVLDEQLPVDNLLDLDLDQLSQTNVVVSASDALSQEVSSVTRTSQPILRTASAVFVITNEMIKRSGARNIPEALRLAPGVTVQQLNSWQWAISIRGFNGAFANKLLVQVDGRAVYTPIFSGTYWDQQFVPLQDIERIEVVRGPGGTVWGANAVNGVINIVTKNARDTQGVYVDAGGGSEHRVFSDARGGGQIGESANYRVYASQLEDHRSFLPGGSPAPDGRKAAIGGFRFDGAPSDSDEWMLQGSYLAAQDGFGGSDGGTGLPVQTYDVDASNIVGRWNHVVDDDSYWGVQLYYDFFNREDPHPITGLALEQNTFDIDTQYCTHWNEWHEVVCGFGYRQYATSAVSPVGGGPASFVPPTDNFRILSCFLQDTMTLSEDLAFLTLGCKLEDNDFVDVVYQPAVKLAVTPNDKTSIWGSVSRAVRTPSVVDRDILYVVPVAANTFYRLQGNRLLDEEQVLSYEIGMRHQTTERFYWDLAAYFNRYDDIISAESVGFSFVGPFTFLESQTANILAADTYGFELLATYEMTSWWRLRGFYAFFREHFDVPPNADILTTTWIGSTPRNQVYFNSGWDLLDRVTLDATLRYADRLDNGVPSYLVMDARVGWRPRQNLEFAVVGQNLLDGSHLEGREVGGISTEVQSGVYGMVSWGY